LSAVDLNSVKLQYYPNPFKRWDLLNITGTEANQGTVSMYSLTRQLILQKENSFEQIQIPGNIPAGIYILKYENNKKTTSVKLIVR
jgi:hypothetical protein